VTHFDLRPVEGEDKYHPSIFSTLDEAIREGKSWHRECEVFNATGDRVAQIDESGKVDKLDSSC
jgi:hypothetical protein